MKRLFLPLTLLVCLLTPLAARAQTQSMLGKVVFQYPDIAPSKVLADPTRNRVYVLEPAHNDLLVFDTNNLPARRSDAAVVLLPVDSIPVDMALSQDRSLLYIANSGSTVHAVSVVGNLDATPPTYLRSISLGGPGLGIAVARDTSGTATNGDDVLFVLTTETIIIPDPIDPIRNPPLVTTITPALVVDGTTGSNNNGQEVGYAPNENLVTHNFVGTSPDGDTVLLAGSLGLERFSVSTGIRIGADPNIGINAVQLVISNANNGQYLCIPDSAGNGGGQPFTTLLFQTSSLDVSSPTGSVGYFGTFSDEAMPGPLAFNTDDTLVYQLRFDPNNGPEIINFSTVTFLKQFPPAPILTNNLIVSDAGRNTITLDNTGSLLFVGTSTSFASDSPGQLVIVSSGTGTLDPFQPPIITTTNLPNGAVAVPYTAPAISARFFPTSYNASGLPMGFSIDPTTGVIFGTTFQAGTYPVTLTATNPYGTSLPVVVNLTITGMTILPPAVTSPTTATVEVNTPFTYQITAANGPTAFNATGLPAGVTVNTATGLISGVPTTVGSFLVTLSASNLAGTGTLTLELTVTPVPTPVITSPRTASGMVGQLFSYQITATNGATRFGANGLPQGFLIDPVTGVISGTPTTAGTFIFSLSATNEGATGTATLTLTVTPMPTPVISSPTASSGTVGTPFSYQISASSTPVSFTASGLPPGVSINTASGLISGTPLTAGTYTVTLTATNISATGTATLTLTIAPNVPTVEIMATVPSVKAGTGDRGAFTISRTGDLAQPLSVAYQIRGSARNGTDFIRISGRAKIKAGRASKTIQIITKGSDFGEDTRSVKLVVLPAVTYQTGAAIKAKVKILAR